MATTSKTGTGANFTEDGRPIDHSLVSLSEYQNARGQPQTNYEGLVYDAAGGSRIMTPQGERYFSPYAAQPTKEELAYIMAQPTNAQLNSLSPMERAQTLESYQKSSPGYVDPMDYKTYEDYAGAANIKSGKDAGNDLTNRANFYGMTIENYQNALAGDPTRPMGANQAVYGSQLLSPIERLAAETARGQGISTMSPKTLALAQANPDVFNAASQRYQNYFANTYPGTLEYESVLSGPMQFSDTGVKYPAIKDTVSMYILDPRTKQYVKNPNYRGVRKAADGGLMSMANQMASKGRGPDSMLIHMSPREVQGLQALAMKHGGSLTINPETGLPEAGFLDKLLPTILGVGLSFIPGVGPLMAAGIVGGIQTARTGDIGKGLAAGLGAYGGAGLAQGLATAGAGALSAEAALGAGIPTDIAANLTDAGISTANADIASQAIQQAQPSMFDKLSAGASQAVSSPQAAGAFLKDNAKNLMYAAGPAIMAGANVQSKGPQTITKPGMIRPYSFDPYGGTYTAGTPYEATPTKAAGGGLMGMNDGGYSPGQLDFTQRSEPVVRMARGGIAHFAAGGDAALAAYQAGNYGEASRLLGEAGMSAQDVVSKYGLSQADAAAVAQNLGYAGDMSGLQYAAAPTAVQAAPVSTAPVDYFAQQFAPDVFAPVATSPVVQEAAAPVVQAAATAPTYTQYTDAQIRKYLIDNPTADITAAVKATNADPAAVNRYIANLTSGYTDPTATKGGSGTAGFYNTLTTQGIDPNEYYAAITAVDPNYATQGFSKADIAEQYAIHKGANALTSQIEKDKIAADPVLGYDKQWVKFMDDNNYSVLDAARAFGLSTDEVKRRYDAVKAAEKKVITPPVVIPPVVTPKITTPITYNTAGTNVPGGLGSVLGLPPGVSGAGITTVNPNGTITTRPDIPGIGDGFTGVKQVRDTFEKGGGNLGVDKNLFAPKTQDELFARYKNTGGSKAAFDYLTGKTPYDPTPYTKTGEIQKPYWESVGRFPENRKAKKYVFVNGKYELNPDYVKPSYVLAGEKAAADKAAATETTKAAVTAGKTINVLDNQGNTEPAYLREDGFYYTSGGNKFDEKGVQVAAGGGLMAMARGGMSQQFDLGGYSDGGRLLRGPGDGVSDSIPATIGNKRPARLADGEFVVPARIVSELGNGSTEAGARKLYAMMDRVQKARRGTVGKGRVAKNSRSEKYLPA
jgi:hypothetical protein